MSRSIYAQVLRRVFFMSAIILNSATAHALISADELMPKLQELAIVFAPVVLFFCYFFYVQRDRSGKRSSKEQADD